VAVEDEGEYCRQIEGYLCRKNGGHLIRIVGPAFEQVCGWAARGIPFKIAQQGIDRYFERYDAKEGRRRPVQVGFCESDVLDVFDEWRRAVGLPQAGRPGMAGEAGRDESGADLPGPRDSLPAHLDRVIARLTAMRAGGDRALDSTIDEVVRELDAARAHAKTARGDVRDALLLRLHELDASLITTLRERCDPQTQRQLDAEADEELRSYRGRMPADAYRESHRAAVDRLLRERGRLPTIAYE
jgi:hypothetical protein